MLNYGVTELVTIVTDRYGSSIAITYPNVLRALSAVLFHGGAA